MVADLESEHRRLAAAWKRLTVGPAGADDERMTTTISTTNRSPGTVRSSRPRQGPGAVVVWAAGPATCCSPPSTR